MSNVTEFRPFGVVGGGHSEYESLLGAAQHVLDAMPGGVYICDREGWLVRYNKVAAEMWGTELDSQGRHYRFCGSHRLFQPDGSPLDHGDCPVAEALRSGTPSHNAEITIERPDGSRIVVLVNTRALRNSEGQIEGAINFFQDISNYKEIEEKARRQSIDLEDFFENSAIGLHIVGSDGIILRANRAELDMLGYTQADYVGRHIAEFHVDAPVIGDILHRLSSGEKLVRYPARLRAKDGSIRHVLITSNSRFENGKFVSTRCFTTDVTSLHDAQSAQRESEARLAATYEAATIGIAEADEGGRLVRVNDAVCKMLGRTREQLLDMTFLDYTDDGDRKKDAELYARQVAGELDSYSIRKRVTKGDGTKLHLDVFSSSVRDEAGHFRYGVRVIHDVTEAQRMEERIRESEKHMRNLLEALPAAVYTTDAEGRITFFNKAATVMAGRTPRPGDHWCVSWRLHRPDGTYLPHDECPMAVALKENRPVRGEEAIAERPDGTLVPFLPYPTPLHDADGNLVGAINMLVDITERKQAENRQKSLIDELNHRVKNTLATVQSLAGQTARHTGNIRDFISRFETRLMALARAHDLLTRRNWESAPLDSLVREIFSPLAGEMNQRVRISGSSIELSPSAALGLTMALNELVTNALKYGSLSSEAGTLSLAWEPREEGGHRVLDLNWQEAGGPLVVPPVRRGFGTKFVERCVERDLGGEIDLAFDPKGVSCSMRFPVDGKALKDC